MGAINGTPIDKDLNSGDFNMSIINLESLDGKPYALLTAIDGRWGNQPIGVFFDVCDNAACHCTDLTIALADLKNPGSQALARFPLDLNSRQRSDADRTQPHNEIIEALVKKLDDDDWKTLWKVFSDLKLELTEEIDFEKTFTKFPTSKIEDDGVLVPYNGVLPFGAKLVLGDDKDGILMDEQYCLRRGCGCTSVTICFIPVKNGVLPPEYPPTIVMNYKTRVIDEIDKASGTKEAVLETWGRFQEKYPTLLKMFSKRHKDLNRLYENFRESQASQSRQVSSSKIGRNDPCPCGSGKKYKKCCSAKVS